MLQCLFTSFLEKTRGRTTLGENTCTDQQCSECLFTCFFVSFSGKWEAQEPWDSHGSTTTEKQYGPRLPPPANPILRFPPSPYPATLQPLTHPCGVNWPTAMVMFSGPENRKCGIIYSQQQKTRICQSHHGERRARAGRRRGEKRLNAGPYLNLGTTLDSHLAPLPYRHHLAHSPPSKS